VERSIFLLKYVIAFDSSIYFAQSEGTDKLIMSGILCESSAVIRSAFGNLVRFLIINTGVTNSSSLSNCVQKLFDVNTIITSPEPSELCQSLILTLSFPKNLYSEKILSKKQKQIFDYLMSDFTLIEKPNKNFIGLLKIIERLILKYELSPNKRIDIINTIFRKWLFPLEISSVDSKQPYCHPEVRECSYKLLSTLSSGNIEVTKYLLKKCIIPLSSILEELKIWAYVPEQEVATEYKGIRNLGNICYLIAMVQQFFWVLPFRNVVLSISKLKSDGLLLQLQWLFGYMKYSIRRDVNPAKFCNVFKEPDGKPLNITIQHDAHEFFNIFCEKIEQELNETEFKDLLKNIFGGRVCSQVKCKYCGFISSTFEDFYSLSVEIKNQKNLIEALYRYIEECTVIDYNCEKCNTKRDVTKRTLLADFPNILIVHLQRFTFNLDTLMNEKIHSRLEFPIELDLYPFTVQMAESEAASKAMETELKELSSEKHQGRKVIKEQSKGNYKSQYKLVGIVIHSGNADAGHYYSYINIEDNKWLEFNDSYVSEFNISMLQSQAFGESEYRISGYGDQRRSSSAYMLFYEKFEKSRISEKIEKIESGDVLMKGKEVVTEKRLIIKEKDGSLKALHRFDKIPIRTIHTLLEEVKQNNVQYTYEKLIYSREFLSFICTVFFNSWQIADKNLSSDFLYSDLYHIGYKMFIEIFPHFGIPAASVQLIERATNSFICLLSNDFNTSKHLLNQFVKFSNKSFSLLVVCPESIVRQYIRKILLNSFITCISFEVDIFDDSPSTKKDNDSIAVTRIFVGMLIKFIGPELYGNWMRFKEYFELLRDVVFSGGHPIVRFVFSKDLLTKLLGLYLEKPNIISHHFNFTNQDPDFAPLMELVYFLILKLKIPRDKEELIDQDAFNISESVQRLLRIEELIIKHIQSNSKAEQMAKSLTYLCYENKRNTKQTAQTLLHLINISQKQETFELLYEYLSITDSYQQQRFELTLGLPFPILKQEFLSNHITAMDAINNYISPIRVEYEVHTILKLLLETKLPMLYVLKILLKLAKEYDVCYRLFKEIPSPNYVYGRYTDWIRDYLESYRVGSDEVVIIKEVIELFNVYESRLNSEESSPIQQYIIGNVLSTNEIKRLEKVVDDVIVTCIEVYTEIYPAIPKKKQKAAANDPKYFLHFIKSNHDTKGKTERSEGHSSDSTAAFSEYNKGHSAIIRIIASTGNLVL